MSAPQFPPVSSEKCVTENGFKQKSDHFCFSQHCKYFGSGEIEFLSLFFMLFFPFLFFFKPLIAPNCRIGKKKKKKSSTWTRSQESFPLSCRLGLFLWCAERLIGFADGLFPTVTRGAKGLGARPAVTASL